jgi:MFS family permease
MATSSGTGLSRNRNWRLLWLGQAISLVGDYVFDTIVVLWIATVIARDKPWAPAAVGGALVAAAAPALVVGPFAGVFVDRWNRRRIMLVSDICRALLIAGLATMPWYGGSIGPAAEISILYCVVAASSCFAQFFNPSRFALLRSIVDPVDQARASGLFQATNSSAAIIGPPIAAPLLFGFGANGIAWALAINAASFAVSFTTIWAVRLAPVPETPPAAGASQLARPGLAEDFRAGLRFFAQSPVLIMLCVGVVVATLGSGTLNALNVFFIRADLHVAAKWLGTLTASEGAGAVAGALAGGWLASKLGSARVFCGGLLLCGVGLIAYSRTTSLPAAVAVIACAGLVIGAVNAAVTPLLLEATPQPMLGRVIAVVQPLQQLAAITAMAGAGFLASTALRGFHATLGSLAFGPYDLLIGVAGVLFVAAGLAATARLRGLEQVEAPRPAAMAGREAQRSADDS